MLIGREFVERLRNINLPIVFFISINAIFYYFKNVSKFELRIVKFSKGFMNRGKHFSTKLSIIAVSK